VVEKDGESPVKFKTTRKQHQTEAAEDYTELISDLIDSKGEARVGIIAECLGISHVTAVRTLQRLAQDDYVIIGRNQPVTLTAKGLKTARYAKARHNLVVQLFIKLGVDKKTAEIDAEGAEHHISAETLRHIKRYLEDSN
jgi:DtxR family transcriptional regulator, manganese transport regulator